MLIATSIKLTDDGRIQMTVDEPCGHCERVYEGGFVVALNDSNFRERCGPTATISFDFYKIRPKGCDR